MTQSVLENGKIPILIGGWEAWPSLNRLDRGGESVHLEPKLMDLLTCLAEHEGEVVSKEELLDRVWKVDHVSDGTLSHAIADLRRVLGDDARHPRYIETIFKRGYRLVAPVEWNQQIASSSAENQTVHSPLPVRRWIALGLVVVTALVVWITFFRVPMAAPREPKIVILPFENFGGEEYGSFAAGITDELISRLAMVSGLRVISATTAFNYDAKGKSARDVGRELGADFLLEGSVRWSSEHEPPVIRVSPQLIRTADDSHVWSGQIDRNPADVLDVQGEIAREIVSHLELRLAEAENRVVTAPPTTDPAAYRAYLKALDRRDSFEPEEVLIAAQMYQRAVEADPLFAQAWAGLSEALGVLNGMGYDHSPERCEASHSALDRALELAAEAPDTMRAVGSYEYFCRRDVVTARDAFQRVLEKWPGDARALQSMAIVCRRAGALDEANRYFQRALELDPRNTKLLRFYAVTLTLAHRYDEALVVIDRAIEISPDTRDGYVAKCYALWYGWGDTSRVAEVLAHMPGPRDVIWHNLAFVNACCARNYQLALSVLRESPGDFLSAYQNCLVADLMDLPEAGDICQDSIAHYRIMKDEQSENPWPRLLLATVCSIAGRHAEARSEALEALKMRPFETDAIAYFEAMIVQAQVAGRAGDVDEAVALVEELIKRGSSLSAAVLRIDPGWESIRQDPRIQAIIREADPAAPVPD